MKKLTPAQKLRATRTLAEYDRIVQWCADHQLPLPKFEYAFHPSRKWRFDVAFVAEKIAIEIEGNIHHKGRHTTGTGFLADCEKYNEAAAMGWRVLRVARPPQAPKWQAVLYRSVLALWVKKILWAGLPCV